MAVWPGDERCAYAVLVPGGKRFGRQTKHHSLQGGTGRKLYDGKGLNGN